MKFNILFAVFAMMVSTIHASGWLPGPSTCDCFNLVLLDYPKISAECNSKTKFLSQINENYGNIFTALFLNGATNNCNFSNYFSVLNGMKYRTRAIVDAYFSCIEYNTEADCTPAILAAYGKCCDFRMENFNPFFRHSSTYLSPQCAEILVEARPPVYGSLENIMNNLLACANLKSEGFSGIKKSPIGRVTQVALPKTPARECNCIKIDPRPMPHSGGECFTPEYISRVRNYIEINFGRIFSEFKGKSRHACDYTKVLGFMQQLKQLALESNKILEEQNPTSVKIDESLKKFSDLVKLYNDAVREHILTNEKPCYFIVRAARQNPLIITHAILSILTKCIG